MPDKGKSFRFLLFLVLFCSLSISMSAQAGAGNKKDNPRLSGKELDEALGDLDLSLRWDPFLLRYEFVRGDRRLSALEEGECAVIDGTRVVGLGGTVFTLQDPQGQARVAALLRKELPLPPDRGERTIRTIFIDPGHGGKDVGAVGKFLVDGKTVSINEKDVTLSVARQLAEQLEKLYPDKKVVLSRSTDIYLPLDERTRIANKYASKNDHTVFVSIHANASLDPKGNGYEVWYLPPEYRRQLIKEEDYDLLDKSLLPIINSMVEEGYSVESRLLATRILRGMQDQIQDRSVNRGLKQEEWYVVRNARMPSVLIEVGFVTNHAEFDLLRSPGYLKDLTLGIYNGLVSFIKDYENPSSGGSN